MTSIYFIYYESQRKNYFNKDEGLFFFLLKLNTKLEFSLQSNVVDQEQYH